MVAAPVSPVVRPKTEFYIPEGTKSGFEWTAPFPTRGKRPSRWDHVPQKEPYQPKVYVPQHEWRPATTLSRKEAARPNPDPNANPNPKASNQPEPQGRRLPPPGGPESGALQCHLVQRQDGRALSLKAVVRRSAWKHTLDTNNARGLLCAPGGVARFSDIDIDSRLL